MNEIELYPANEADFPFSQIQHVEGRSSRGDLEDVRRQMREQAAIAGANAVVRVEYRREITLTSWSTLVGRGIAVRRQSAEIKCPVCAESIKREAKRCRFCGTEISGTANGDLDADAQSSMGEAPRRARNWFERHTLLSAILLVVGVLFVVSLIPPAIVPQTPAPTQTAQLATAAPAPVAPVEPPAPRSPWHYSTDQDDMTDGAIHHACTTSTNLVHLDFPYERQPVELCIRQHPRWGQDVTVRLTRGGQFLCHSYQQCAVRIRFDDGEVAAYSANEPSDNSSDVIFIANDARFVQNAKRASTLVVEASFYQAGAQTMMFEVRDLEWPRP